MDRTFLAYGLIIVLAVVVLFLILRSRLLDRERLARRAERSDRAAYRARMADRDGPAGPGEP